MGKNLRENFIEAVKEIHHIKHHPDFFMQL